MPCLTPLNLRTGGNQCYDDTGDLSDPSTLYTSAGAGNRLAPALVVTLPGLTALCNRRICLAGVGPRYLKALYHEYTDATFQVRSISSCVLVTCTHASCRYAMHPYALMPRCQRRVSVSGLFVRAAAIRTRFNESRIFLCRLSHRQQLRRSILVPLVRAPCTEPEMESKRVPATFVHAVSACPLSMCQRLEVAQL